MDYPVVLIPVTAITIFLIFVIFGSRQPASQRMQQGSLSIRLLVPLIYWVAALSSLIVDADLWYPYFDSSSYTTFAFGLYSALIFIFLIPSAQIRRVNLSQIYLPKPLVYFMIFGGAFSIIFQTPYVIQGITANAHDLRAVQNAESIFLLPDSILTTAAVGIATFYPFFILAFFVALGRNYSLAVKAGLFLGSTSYVATSLTFAARDGALFYLTTVIFVYLLTGNSLNEGLRRRIRRSIMLLGICFGGVLVVLTIERFLSYGVNDLAWGTIGYIGSQPFTFAETIAKHEDFYGGWLRFPAFLGAITGSDTPAVERVYNYETMFGTFLKDFYSEGGYTALFLLSAAFLSFFYLGIRSSSKQNETLHAVYALFYFQFMSTGLFFYTLGARSGNIYTAVVILLITVLSLGLKTKPHIHI